MAQINTKKKKYVRILNEIVYIVKTKTKKKQNSYRSVFELGEEILNLVRYTFLKQIWLSALIHTFIIMYTFF